MYMTMIVVFVYLAAMVAIGFYYKNKSKNMNEYFAGDKSFGLWKNVNTMAATAIGAGSTMGIAGLTYSAGIGSSWILIGYTIGFVLIATLIAKRMHSMKAITLTDVVGSRFGGTAKFLTSVLVLVQYIGVGAGQILALGVVTQQLMGWSFQTSIIIFGAIIICYTMIGGIFALATTDAIQMIINAFGIMVLLPFLGLVKAGGLHGLVSSLPASHFNIMGLGIATSIGFLSWIIPQGFLSQELWIRVFASKDESVAKKSALIAALGVYVPHMISVVIIGLVGAVLFPGIAGDAVVPHMILKLANPFLGGIIFAALLATIMSCASSVLLVSGSNLMKDLYMAYFNKGLASNPKKMLMGSKISVLIIGVVQILMALGAKGIISLMENVATPYCGALFPIILAVFFWKRATQTAASVTMVVSLAASAFLLIVHPNILGLHPIVINIVLCTLVLVVVSLFTKNSSDTNRLAGEIQ